MIENIMNEIDILNSNIDEIKKGLPHKLTSRISEAVEPGLINVRSIAKRVLKTDGWALKPNKDPGILFESEEKDYQLVFVTQSKGHMIQFIISDKYKNESDTVLYGPKLRNKTEVEYFMENILTITKIFDEQLKIPNKGLAKRVVFVFNRLCFWCDDTVYDIKSFDEVSRYVKGNIDKLSAFPFEKLDEMRKMRVTEHQQMISNILGRGSIVSAIYVPDENENIVNFYCSGHGWGPPECRKSSAYTGFYYSKDGKPYGESFCRFELEAISLDEYVYHFNDYSYIYTRRILDHWYYFCEEIYITTSRFKK